MSSPDNSKSEDLSDSPPETVCDSFPEVLEGLQLLVQLDLHRGVQYLLPQGEDSSTLEPCYDPEVIVDTICGEREIIRVEPTTLSEP